MGRRSSQVLGTRPFVSGMRSQSARGARRVGKAGSITDDSSGDFRTPGSTTHRFFPHYTDPCFALSFNFIPQTHLYFWAPQYPLSTLLRMHCICTPQYTLSLIRHIHILYNTPRSPRYSLHLYFILLYHTDILPSCPPGLDLCTALFFSRSF
jgi:hypothetical protein